MLNVVNYKPGMFEFVQKGGPLMWLLIFCSVVATAVFFERLTYFHRASIVVGDLLRGIANLVQRRDFAGARQECAVTAGPVARVIHAAILRHDAPRAELKEIVQEAGQLEIPKLERNLTILNTIAFLAPLIGLLGTVTGLIEAFVTISSQSGFTSSTEISKGIYQCLLMTAAGLAVAIPTALAGAYLSARVNALMHEIERGGIEIVNLLTDLRRKSADIIEFGSSSSRKANAE